MAIIKHSDGKIDAIYTTKKEAVEYKKDKKTDEKETDKKESDKKETDEKEPDKKE